MVLWSIYASLLSVRTEVVTISKPLSQNNEIAVCSSLSPPGHTASLSVCAAKNCSILHCRLHSRTPVLTPRAGHSAHSASKTASCTPVHTCTPVVPGSSLVGYPKVLSPWLPVCESVPSPQCGRLLPSWYKIMEVSSPIHLSSGICLQNHGFPLHTSRPSTADMLFVEIQIYLLTSDADFLGVQNDLVDSQLNSGDRLK